MELTHIAQREGRLSTFLRGELNMSAGLMNRLKWGDGLRVNGMPQKTNYPVEVGDVISVCLDEAVPDYPAQQGELTVLFEDEHILAVDKPTGMLIHPSSSCFTGTLANYVLGYYQRTGQKCAYHPVTRLDRDTFGVVLLAKNSHSHSAMQKTALQKTYHAWVLGCPGEKSGVWDAPIIRKPLPSLLRQVHPDGKPCVTEFSVLSQGEETAVLALRPVTGRTHQLRVHCDYYGFPILGDPQYGTERTAVLSKTLGLTGQALCAKFLEFIHPITKEYICLESKWNVK